MWNLSHEIRTDIKRSKNECHDTNLLTLSTMPHVFLGATVEVLWRLTLLYLR